MLEEVAADAAAAAAAARRARCVALAVSATDGAAAELVQVLARAAEKLGAAACVGVAPVPAVAEAAPAAWGATPHGRRSEAAGAGQEWDATAAPVEPSLREARELRLAATARRRLAHRLLGRVVRRGVLRAVLRRWLRQPLHGVQEAASSNHHRILVPGQ